MEGLRKRIDEVRTTLDCIDPVGRKELEHAKETFRVYVDRIQRMFADVCNRLPRNDPRQP